MSIEKDEWIHRCANRLIEKAAVTKKIAVEVAESCWENCLDHTDPEGDADEELSYWGD